VILLGSSGFEERQEDHVSQIFRPNTARVADMIEAAAYAIVICDAAGRIRLVNTQTERLFGFPAAELLGQPVDFLLPYRTLQLDPGGQADDVRRLRALLTGIGQETIGRRRDGSEIPVDVTSRPLETDEGLLTVVTIRDVSLLKRTLQVLGDSVRRLQETDRARVKLLTHLVRAQEEERKRLAADIYDDTIQAITVASLRLQQLRRRLGDPGDRKLLTRLEETMQLAIGRLHHLVFDLWPPGFERGGFLAAVQQCLQQLRAETGAVVIFDHELSADLPTETQVLAYRLAQEALTNVRRHAHSSTVRVRLREVGDGVLATVSDDGIGYDPRTAGARTGHLGLTLMHERALIAGGWCRTEGTPGGGATVEFWIPRIDEAADRPEEHSML
jgi:PAS domain S-box-containing protein